MVGKKNLILEENGASRKFISNLLHQKQIEAFEASSGKEALLLPGTMSRILSCSIQCYLTT